MLNSIPFGLQSALEIFMAMASALKWCIVQKGMEQNIISSTT